MLMFSLRKTVKTSTVKKKNQDSSGSLKDQFFLALLKLPVSGGFCYSKEFQSCL